MRSQKKKFANIGMAGMTALMSLKTAASRRAVADNSEFLPGTHYLQAPVRLYLLLHFYADSNDGLIKDADLVKLSEELLIHIKTLRAALKKLEAGGFIAVSEDPETGIIDIRICNILDMYKRSGEGGKGYVTLSEEQLAALISSKKTNELRLTLTTLMRSVTAMLHSASGQSDTAISFKTVRAGLPHYIKPCILRHYLSEGVFSRLFELKAKDRKLIRVRLQPAYDAADLKAKKNEESRRRIKAEVDQIVNQIDSINAEIRNSGWFSGLKWLNLLKDHNIDLSKNDELTVGSCTSQVRLFRFSNQNLRDAVRIAQDYDDDIVVRSIQCLYNKYLTVHNGAAADSDIRGKDIGGLLRRIVEELTASGGMQDLSLPAIPTA